MFPSLVITLREGVEAALILSVVLGCLQRTGRHAWSRIAYWGLFAAILASLFAGYGIYRFTVQEDVYEGWLMLAGAVFVASMVFWMWRTGRRMKQGIESRLSEISASGQLNAASSSSRRLTGKDLGQGFWGAGGRLAGSSHAD